MSSDKNEEILTQNNLSGDSGDSGDIIHTSQEGSSYGYPGAEYGAEVRKTLRRLTEDRIDESNDDLKRQ
jgi:hypothetical protein